MRAFMMKPLMILIALGFATSAFAGSHPEPPEQSVGCGKNSEVRCTGTKYRCLKHFGKTESDARAGGGYCLPKVAISCSDAPTEDAAMYDDLYNMKQWDWSTNNKIDTVVETGRSKKNCKFTTCWPQGTPTHFWYGATSNSYQPFYQADKQYSETPIDGYFFCAKEGNDFNTIAKCVNKTAGQEVDSSHCEKDTQGTTYYYKPNCKTKEECTRKMNNWGMSGRNIIRFCYNPFPQRESSNVKVFFEKGGQSVQFQEFIYSRNGNINGPCQLSPFRVVQLNYVDVPPEPKGDLVVVDDADSDRDASFVHTKVSGDKYKFRLYMVGENGKKLDKEIKNATCTVSGQGGGTTTKSKATQRNTNIFSKAIARLTGKSGYLWGGNDGNGWSTDISGDYTIKCDGETEDGTALSTGEVAFFVAPHKYVFSNVSVSFNKGAESKKQNPPLDLLKSKVEVERTSNAQDADKGKTQSVKIADWKNKPVIRISEELSVSLLEAVAMTSTNKVDLGVAANAGGGKQMGEFSAEANIQTMRIADFNKTPNYQNSTLADKAKCEIGGTNNFNPITVSSVTLINNNNTLTLQGNPFATLQATEAQIARANIYIYDVGLRNKIDEEAKNLKCNDNNKFPCPYPKKLLLSDFEYEVAPFNFKAEVLDKNGNPVKVLYFGQGTSPKVEAGSSVRVTALKADGTTTATTFSGGKNGSPVCAAQNMQFSGASASGGNTTTGQSVYIEIVGRDGNGFSVNATDFENGVASSTDAIIKVQKDKDMVFTPAMKSEPIIITDKNGVTPSEMRYLNFLPADSYYPLYSGIALGGGNIAILRGRINAIDTDNGTANNIGAISPTKVWYEFQCEYCNLDKITAITGKTYTRSPTQQGWWIDSAFGENNGNYITTNKIGIESGGLTISAVNPNNGVATGANDAGLQSISYGNATQGTYKLNILHGNFTKNGNSISDGDTALSMPYFLLYNAFWTGTQEIINGVKTSTLTSPIKWNTSSFIYVKGKAADDKRNYGVDTGGAKNTRSGGRTGKY